MTISNPGSVLNRTSIALVVLLLSMFTCLNAVSIEQNTPPIVSSLVDSLVFSVPVILDIRCGEWSPAMEREMRMKLLSKGIDLRETNPGFLEDSSDTLLVESNDTYSGKLLQKLNLLKADLLELSLEQTIETGEKRALFSYARYNTPMYRFELKQIALPEQRLVAMKEFKLSGNPEIENPGSLLAMKWYEPILAGAVLSSLVMMLWTLK